MTMAVGAGSVVLLSAVASSVSAVIQMAGKCVQVPFLFE
jgi:hypothetical protein